jgi:DNA-binding MarR family transcriptional regulator
VRAAPVRSGNGSAYEKVAAFRAALLAFESRADTVARRQGLTPKQHLLLLFIKAASERSEEATVGRLAAWMCVAPSSVSGLVSRAIRKGLVERAASPLDGRVSELRLTAEGERRLAAAVQALGTPRRLLAKLLHEAFRGA